MRKFLIIVAAIALFLLNIYAFADVTVKKDLQGQPLGRYEVVRFITGGTNCTPTGCTGGSGQVYASLVGTPNNGASGETITVDLTNPSGINWSALGALGQTVSWVGANIAPLTGINWAAFPNAGAINWYTVPEQFPQGVNWNAIAPIPNSAMNWQDFQAAQQGVGTAAGVNWQDLDPKTGAINWLEVTSGGSNGNLMCIKAGGHPGHCALSFSSTGAGSCTCL